MLSSFGVLPSRMQFLNPLSQVPKQSTTSTDLYNLLEEYFLNLKTPHQSSPTSVLGPLHMDVENITKLFFQHHKPHILVQDYIRSLESTEIPPFLDFLLKHIRDENTLTKLKEVKIEEFKKQRESFFPTFPTCWNQTFNSNPIHNTDTLQRITDTLQGIDKEYLKILKSDDKVPYHCNSTIDAIAYIKSQEVSEVPVTSASLSEDLYTDVVDMDMDIPKVDIERIAQD